MAHDLKLPESARISGIQYVSEGGSGLVFRATHDDYGPVAVKVAHNQNSETVEQFKREYTILRGLNHEGICRMFDFGWTEEGRPFAVMEWLGGGDLYGFTDRQPPAQRLANFGRLLASVCYLHDLGIVHRDLKGDNVLIDDNMQPKLTDLGLAAAVGDNDGRCGTLEYMAPEVIDNRGATVQSDIYAIGVILYRVLTDRLPFVADDPLHLIAQKRDLSGLDLETMEVGRNSRLTEIVGRCLSPDPMARFRSVAGLLEQLGGAGVIERKRHSYAGCVDLLNYHLYGYNTSFVRNELKCDAPLYLIDDHHQAGEAGLWKALSDHLKLSQCEVTESSAAGITCRWEGLLHSFHLSSDSGERNKEARKVEFAELEPDSLRVILERLFGGGIDKRAVTLINRFSAGNLHLLKIILSSLERHGLISNVGQGLRLTLPEAFDFSVPAEYLDVIGSWLPEACQRVTGTISLLAADPFDSGGEFLAQQGVAASAELERLAALGLLTRPGYRFATSYLREYFYGISPQEQSRDSHLTWISLIEKNELLTARDRSEQLFYHFSQCGDVVAAATEGLEISRILNQQNEPEEAREIVARARKLPRLNEHPGLYLRVLMRSADLAKAAGEFNCALTEYAGIVRSAQRQGEIELLAEAYKDLGDVYKARGSYLRGTKALQKALELYRTLDDDLELSHCYNNMGNIDWIAGNISEAEQNYLSALEIQRRLDIKRDVASTLSNLASIRLVSFRLDECVSLYKEAISLSRELNEMAEVARTANNLAVAYLWQDELDLAKEYLSESLTLNKSLRAQKELLYNYENLGEIDFYLGRIKEARAAYHSGLRLAPLSDHVHRGVYTTKLALTFLREGEYSRAGKLLKLAVRHESKVSDRIFSLELALTLGKYYLTHFDFDRAGSFLEQAMRHAEKLGDVKKKLNALLLSARVESMLSSNRQSLPEQFREADSLLGEFPLRRECLLSHLEITEHFLSAGRIDQARRRFEQITVADSFDGSELFIARAKYLEALIAVEDKEYPGADLLLTESASAAREYHQPEQLWRTLAAQGRAQHAMNRHETALRCYMDAYEVLKRLALKITDSGLRNRYLSDSAKSEIADALEKLTAIAT